MLNDFEGCYHLRERTLRPGCAIGDVQITACGHISVSSAEAVSGGGPDLCRGIVRAYARWGQEFPAHASGEFVTALADRTDGSFLLAHDIFGLQQAFYLIDHDHCHFSSDLSTLSRRSSEDDLDLDYLAEFALQGFALNQRTPFKGIRRLCAGEVLRIDRSGTITLGQHMGALVRNSDPRRSAGNLVDTCRSFRTLLHGATQVATAGEPIVAAELSGGLDSSSIVSIMAKLERPPKTVSVVLPSRPKQNEQPWIRDVIDKYRLDGRILDGDDFPALSELPDRWMEPSTFVIGEASHSAICSAAADQGSRILLSGIGGDQVCYGDVPEPAYLAELASRGRWITLARELSRWRAADPAHRSRLHYGRRYVFQPLKTFAQGMPLAGTKIEIPPWIAPQFHRRMETIRAARGRSARFSSRIAEQAFWEQLVATARLASQMKSYRRRVDMRFPMFFPPLTAFMASLAQNDRFSPAQDRILQRRSLVDVLPESVRTRTSKAGGEASLFEALRRNPTLCDLLGRDPLIAQLGIVRLEIWQTWVARARFGHPFHLTQFFAMASLELWLRHRFQGLRSIAHVPRM